jgi:broad-specificity NMP kinase
MPLVFIAGIAGAGKSSVGRRLRDRGFRSYDTDEDEIAQWRHKVTGVVTPLLAEAHRTPEFLSENVWTADPDRVRGLAETGDDDFVFLCGSAGNENQLWPLFDRVILLSIDEATMRHRLATRTDHDFGTRPHELDLLIALRSVIDDHYLARGAIRIDATQALPVVVNDIVSVLGAT